MKLRATFRDPWIVVWSAITVLLIVTCTALGVGLYAVSRSSSTGACVNSILGERAPLLAADHANERRKIEDQIVAENDEAAALTQLSKAKTQADVLAAFQRYQRGSREFVSALNHWKARDDVINAEKARSPLGEC